MAYSAAKLNSGEWFHDDDSVLEVLRGEHAQRRAQPRIAGYDSLEEISRGGQGVVYSAVQRSTRRRVAIKVLLDGVYATAACLRRFEREIELVAALRHPHIVRVYDSGVSSDGRPYCVMEFLDGDALDDYLASKRPSVRDMLELFISICDAVQHAHQHGVVHRDLKPSNIRVDTAGQPRVLDFGLAKAADPAVSQTAMTHTGHFFGSLPWTSPEQVRGEPSQIDLRCDVYSLGVLLHQALTGRFPYDVNGPLHEVSQRILLVEPTRLSRDGESLPEDLSTVVLKALAKEPARRYQSAGDLAADLRRVLKGEPIQARADSKWYVLSKTLRRHRLAAGTITGFVVLLAVFGVTMSVMYRQTVRARDAARAEAVTVTAVNDFMRHLLMSVEPGRGGYRMTVAELLDQAAKDIPARFAGQPESEALLEHTLGEAFTNLGRYTEGQLHLQRALEIRRRVLGEDHLDTLETLAMCWDFGETATEKMEMRQRDLKHIYDIRRHVLGADEVRTLQAVMDWHAFQAQWMGVDNVTALRSVMEHCERVLGESHETTMYARLALARVLIKKGRSAEGEAEARHVLAVCDQLPDPENRYKLAAMMEVGDSLLAQGRYEEALAVCLFPYQVKVRVLGARHPATVLSAEQLKRIYEALNQTDRAHAIARASLDEASDTP